VGLLWSGERRYRIPSRRYVVARYDVEHSVIANDRSFEKDQKAITGWFGFAAWWSDKSERTYCSSLGSLDCFED
jgi:hypothetical protein